MDGSRLAPPPCACVTAGDWPLPAPGRLAALAILRRIDGPAYRPEGAAMALDDAGRPSGQLSGGCVDADIVHHLRAVASGAAARHLRYGAGSAFADLRLPCGGALEIDVLPAPPLALQRAIAAARAGRAALSLWLGPQDLSLAPDLGGREIRLLPDPRIIAIGAGPEAAALAALAAAAGYPAQQIDPSQTGALAALRLDRRSGAALFFHDHEREMPVLAALREAPLGYLGAQGSRRAAAARAAALAGAGWSAAEIARLRGPIGLVAQARDARLLAVSVLAEMLAALRAEAAG